MIISCNLVLDNNNKKTVTKSYILIIYKNKGSVIFSFLSVNYHKNSAYLLHA